jgi:hypothetical protein
VSLSLPLVSGPLRIRGLLPRGVNTPMLAEDISGLLWVRKDIGTNDMSPEGLLGEILGWAIGRHVGVRIPDAALWKGNNGMAWLSSWIDGTIGWDPAMVSRYDLGDLGTITALDVVLLNRDRNPGNLLIEADLTSPMRIWAIDHERTGSANLDFLRKHRDDSLHQIPELRASFLQPAGVPIAGIWAHALHAAEQFTRLEADWLFNIVVKALAFSGYVEDGVERSALIHQRCQQAPALITSWLDARQERTQ